ncbi:AraC family transcriptional regulator [Haloferula helveola]
MARFRYLRRYALVLITRGSGIYEDEKGRQRSLSAGNWILVLPELGHSYRPLVPGGWDEVYVMFEGPVFEAWRSAGQFEADRLVGFVSNVKSVVSRLKREVIESTAPVVVRLCSFQTLLAEVLEGADDVWDSEVKGPPWFIDACRLLARPGASARQVAGDLGLPYDTFRRRFREHAGMPPHRYHRHQIVNRAERMLDQTDMKSADVAEALGFCDEPYFSRVFKEITGRSPREYRQRQELG